MKRAAEPYTYIVEPGDVDADGRIALDPDRAPRTVELWVDEDGEIVDRVVSYRASSLSTCVKAIVAYANGRAAAELPERMREVFDEGHAAEPKIRARFANEHEMDVVRNDATFELVLGVIEHGGEEHTVVVRGSVDGIAVNGSGECSLFEAKKFRPSTWPDFLRRGVECNDNYPWQVSAYMHGLELDSCYFVGGKLGDPTDHDEDEWGGTGREVVVDEIHAHYLPNPPIPLREIRKRVMGWEKMIADGMDAGDVACDRTMYPCAFFKLHEDKVEVKGATVVSRGEGGEDTERIGLVDLNDEDTGLEGLMLEVRVAAAAVASAATIKKKAEDNKRAADKILRDALTKLSERAAEDERLRSTVPGVEGVANAKKVRIADFELTHTVKFVAEHTRKASTQDYISVKKLTDDKEGE